MTVFYELDKELYERVLSLEDSEFREFIEITKEVMNEFILTLKTKKKEGEQRGRPRELPICEEVLLFFLHFRHYPVDILLGVLFNIPPSTANGICKRVLNDLYEIRKPRISMKDYQWRLEHSCEVFHTRYTFLVDGSEQGVQRSKLPLQDGRFFSAKKKKHSINILLVVSVIGKKILYLSQSFPGKDNDPKIVVESKSKWHDLLEPNEFGVGDSIFSFESPSIHIHPPPKDEHCDLYKEWCKIRVPVENVIECVKNFGACKDDLRIPVTGNEDDILITHHKYWTLGGSIVNDYYNFS